MHGHYNDGNKDSGHKSMMWMMVICCLLPVVVLFGGTGFFKSIGYNWIGIGLVGIFLIIHFGKIWRANSHNLKGQNPENQEDKGSRNNRCH